MTAQQQYLRLDTGQFSHPGRKRANNEDWLGKFEPVDAERLAQKGSLFIVADGMGGHHSGELASRHAVDQVIRGYVEAQTPDVPSSLRQAIEAANASLYAESMRREEGPAGKGWGTTLVAVVIRGGELWLANVGDSRAYLLRNGRLRQLSKDHVLFPECEGPNEPEGEWLGRHVITRALGLGSSVEVDLFPPLSLRDGDRVLLCSDGLTGPLTDDRICQSMGRHSAQKTAEVLVQAANEQGGPDNVSVVLVGISISTGLPILDGARGAWRTVSTLVFWQGLADGVGRALPGEGQANRTSLLIVLVLLVILILVGFGFCLGLVLF